MQGTGIRAGCLEFLAHGAVMPGGFKLGADGGDGMQEGKVPLGPYHLGVPWIVTIFLTVNL